MLIREAKKDYRFSNGLKITKGNYVCASLYSLHRDEGVYKDALEFQPWRFVGDSSESGNDGGNMQHYTSTGPEFLSFGYGKHAW
jgi:cytochrome P450